MSDYFPSYMHIPPGVGEFSARDNVYILLQSVKRLNVRSILGVLPEFRPSLQGHTLDERLGKWKLLFDENVANTQRLVANIRHPLNEWLHTGHILYRLPDSGLWRMDHYWMESHVCTDVLRENPEGVFLGKGDVGYKWMRFEHLARFALDGKGCENELSRNVLYTRLNGSSGNSLLELLAVNAPLSSPSC